jgi:hypothetical protein
MRTGRGNRSTRWKPAPVPLCPPQIPYDLTWSRSRTVAVGSLRKYITYCQFCLGLSLHCRTRKPNFSTYRIKQSILLISKSLYNVSQAIHIMNKRKALFRGNAVDGWAYSGDAGFSSSPEQRLSLLTFLVVSVSPFRCNTVSSRSLRLISFLIYSSQSSSMRFYI